MNSYIALLRGVNVSGKNRIKMPELIALLSAAGFRDMKSYLQSGNLVFKSDQNDPKAVAGLIEELIKRRLDLEVAVLVKNKAEMAEAAAHNPFVKPGNIDPAFVYVTFLFGNPAKQKISLIESIKDPIDSFRVVDSVVYLHCPGGYGKTKFSNNFFEKKLGTAATTRNWRTVNALLELAAGLTAAF